MVFTKKNIWVIRAIAWRLSQKGIIDTTGEILFCPPPTPPPEGENAVLIFRT
jgi:hypothetical protein